MKTRFICKHIATPSSRIAVAVAALASCTAVLAQDPPIVGETTMVIGLVKLVGADGTSRAVARGASVRIGDRIETQAGGHVHLRFVDGGRVSVRPASILQIEDYSHSAQQPLLGAIKFRLDEGVVRSITGSWGEAARDRFRLNTPVAAIGVKGTDFVVRAEGSQTQASVYTGAITVTPMDSACSNTVGPCINGHEKLLSEDMKGQMLELNRQQTTPQLVPSVDLLARSARPASGIEVVATARTGKPLMMDDVGVAGRAPDALVSDSRAATVVAAMQPLPSVPPTNTNVVEIPIVAVYPPVVDKAAVIPSAPVIDKPQPIVEQPVPVVEVPVAVAVPVQPTPVVVPVGPPQVNQLMFARVSWINKMDADTFTRNWDDALASGKERMAGVGIGTYNLFRPVSAVGAVLTSSDASAEFRLASATAQVTRQFGRIEPVSVTGGTFTVDFTRSTFATALNMSNPDMGADTLMASGNIKPNGMLQTTNSNGNVTGALTLDGKEAGYAFDKQTKIGSVIGAALWGR